MAEVKREREAFSNESNKAKKEILAIRNEKSQLEGRNESLSIDLEEARQNISIWQNQLKEQKELIGELQQQNYNLQKYCKELETKKATIATQERIKNLENNLSTTQNELKNTEGKLDIMYETLKTIREHANLITTTIDSELRDEYKLKSSPDKEPGFLKKGLNMLYHTNKEQQRDEQAKSH